MGGGIWTETNWQEIPSAALMAVEGLVPGAAFTLAFDFTTPGPDGNPGKPGQPIQILAVDRTTGQSTGTSFVVPGR